LQDGGVTLAKFGGSV